MRAKTPTFILVICYLSAIVGANLIITAFGKPALMIVSVVLIPFDLFSRDILHTRWQSNNLFIRLAALILTGSFLSFLINSDSYKIGLASCASFGAAAIIDSVVYQLLIRQHQFIKMTASNLFSSCVDSLLFITIAFGFNMSDILHQAAAKTIGSLLWTILYCIL